MFGVSELMTTHLVLLLMISFQFFNVNFLLHWCFTLAMLDLLSHGGNRMISFQFPSISVASYLLWPLNQWSEVCQPGVSSIGGHSRWVVGHFLDHMMGVPAGGFIVHGRSVHPRKKSNTFALILTLIRMLMAWLEAGIWMSLKQASRSIHTHWCYC